MAFVEQELPFTKMASWRGPGLGGKIKSLILDTLSLRYLDGTHVGSELIRCTGEVKRAGRAKLRKSTCR